LHKNVVLFTGIQVEYRTRLVMGRWAPLERWSFPGKEVVTSSAKFWQWVILLYTYGLRPSFLRPSWNSSFSYGHDIEGVHHVMSCHGLYKLEVWEIMWKQWVRVNATQFRVIAVLQKGSSSLRASCIL
jgi:hypothetical protein